MKKAISLILVLCLVLVSAGCSTTMSYTYTVDNGDCLSITMDTTDGYKLSSGVPFTVTQHGEEVSTGQFLYSEYYTEYVNIVQADSNSTVLDSGEKDGSEYLFWNYNDTEYNYVMLVGGTDTAILISNLISEESARACIDRLTVSVLE